MVQYKSLPATRHCVVCPQKGWRGAREGPSRDSEGAERDELRAARVGGPESGKQTTMCRSLQMRLRVKRTKSHSMIHGGTDFLTLAVRVVSIQI